VIDAPAGTYHINVWPPFDSNYIYYEQPTFSVSSNIKKNITLATGYKISGYITDSLGNPVSDGIVFLDNYFCGWYSKYSGRYFVTAPAGTYTLKAKPRSGYFHFSEYSESNFVVSHDITKNIIVSGYTPPIQPQQPFVDPSSPSTSMIWNRTYGGEPYESAESVIETSDGGFAAAGWSWPSRTYVRDIILVKTDKFGNMEWAKNYGIKNGVDDTANSVIETSDGGFAIAGSIRVEGTSNHRDMVLIKTDADGLLEWEETYGGTEDEGASDVVETSDGGYAIAGYTSSFGAGDSDFWLVKTDEFRELQWNQTYGGTGRDEANSLVETPDGGYVLAGVTESFGAGGRDFWLIKTDKFGNIEWNQTYGGTGSEQLSAFVETYDGGYALAGGGFLVKTDANGVMEWNQTYSLPPSSYTSATTSLTATSDGGFAFSHGHHLFKLDEQGNVKWNQTFEGAEIRSVQALVATSDGGYALAGFYGSVFEDGSGDVWMIRTTEYGYIPEFPTWIILPLFFTATLITASARRRIWKH